MPAHPVGYWTRRGFAGSSCCYLSVPLMLEYESVLTRPEHLAACGATTEAVSAVLDELALVCERVELAVCLRPMLSDPNDEMVFETVINGRADAVGSVITQPEGDISPGFT